MKLKNQPLGTIIDIEGSGKYEKVTPTSFQSMEHKHRYYTTPYLKTMRKRGVKITVVAVPWSVVVELMQMHLDEIGPRDDNGKLIIFDDIYKDAIKRDKESKERIATRKARETMAQTYCEADVKLTEAMMSSLPRKMQSAGYTPYQRMAEPRPSVIYRRQRSNVEEWRKIPGYNYSVSSQGRVRNNNVSQHIVKPFVKHGVVMVELTDDDGRYVETSMAWILRAVGATR